MRMTRNQIAAMNNTNKRMSAQTDNQSSQDATSTTVLQSGTIRGNLRKRPRAQSQSIQAQEDDEYQADIQAATRKAERLRNIEAAVRRIDEQHAEHTTSYKKYKEAMETRQSTNKSTISLLEKGIKLLPTITAVRVIVGEECKAREKALSEAALGMTAHVTTCINASLNNFQHNVMKPALATELTPMAKRMEDFEVSLNAEKDSLAGLSLQLNKLSDMEDLQNKILDEVEKKTTEADHRISKFTTQLKTQIDTCTSKLENFAIPRELDPLRQKIDNVNAICTSTETKVLAVTVLQQKQEEDHERRVKELEKKFGTTQDSHTKILDQLKGEVNVLQQKLQTERLKNSDQHTAHKKDMNILREAVDALRNELGAERDKRERLEKTNENILHRLQDIEQKQSVVSEELPGFDARLKQLGAQTAAKLLGLEQTSRQQLEKHRDAAKADTVRADQDLQSRMDQLRLHIMGHIDEVSNANNSKVLRNRVDGLELAISQGHDNLNSKVTNVQAELIVYKKFVFDFAAAAKNVNKRVDLIMPMSADLAYLKDQHQDHVVNCKAQIQEQANIATAHTNRVGREIKGRIQDQELVLQGHLLETHAGIDKPVFLQQQKDVHKLLQTLKAGLKGLAERYDMFLATEFKNLVEQHKELEERYVALNVLVGNMEGQGRRRSVRRVNYQLD